MAAIEQDRYISVKDASKLTSLSRVALYNQCASGKLPHVRVGARICIKLSDLEQFMNMRQVSIEDIDRMVNDAIAEICGR